MTQLITNHRVLNCLSEDSDSRSIQWLCNGQIELRWEGVTLFLRVADLLVLDKSLRQWMDDVDRAWCDAYALSLGYIASPAFCLYLRRDVWFAGPICP